MLFPFMLSIFMIFSLISVSIVNIHVHKVHKSYPFGTLLCNHCWCISRLAFMFNSWEWTNYLSSFISYKSSNSEWYYALLSAYYSWELQLDLKMLLPLYCFCCFFFFFSQQWETTNFSLVIHFVRQRKSPAMYGSILKSY